jgi:hypothetical protein
MGYPVEINVGVDKQSGRFFAHSWVTVMGNPIAYGAPPGTFKVVYSYPPKGTHAQNNHGGHYGEEKTFAAAG